MVLPFWGELFKSQFDNEKIEEAIARMIREHNQDPEAHLLPGGSLYSHKFSEIIDHVAESIIEDKIRNKIITAPKIHPSGLVADAVVAPEGGDFNNIQDAIDYGYNYIYIKKGVYEIDSYIHITRSNIKLIGEDREKTIIIPKPGMLDGAIVIGDFYDPNLDDIENIEIANLSIGQPDKKMIYGIIVYASHPEPHYNIRNVKLHDIDFYISNSVGITVSEAQDVFIYNNAFFDFSGTKCINISSPFPVFVFNNTIYRPTGETCIEVFISDITGAPSYILNNTILGTSSSSVIGIYARSPGAIIANNFIKNTNYLGMWIADYSHHFVLGNIIINEGAGAGIYVAYSDYSIISNNFVKGCSYFDGLRLSNSNYCLVKNNLIIDSLRGIGISNASYNSIISNYLRGNNTGLEIFSGSLNYVRLNYVLGNTTNFVDNGTGTIIGASTTNDNVV